MEPEWFDQHKMKSDWEHIISGVLKINKSNVNVTKNPDRSIRFFRRLNDETSLIVLIGTNEEELETIIETLIGNDFKVVMNEKIRDNSNFMINNLTDMMLQTVKPMEGNQR